MNIKKIIISAIFLSLFLPVITWAASFSYTPMEQIPGFATDGNFYNYIAAVYKFGIWGVGISALLMITIGGYMYISSAANVASVDKSKAVITDAIIGLILALISYLLLYEINPNLVRLDSGKIASTATTAPTTTTPSTTTPTTQTSPPCAITPNYDDICSSSCKKTCPPSHTALVEKYASANVPKKLIESIICHESGGKPNAISTAGACGLMQVMPAAGFTCATDPRNLLDPESNIKIGTQLFASKLAAVNSLSYPSVTKIEMAAASYNCCANGKNPNDPSVDCAAKNIPAWACPINPGTTSTSNMCTVKDYACDVAACAS